MRMDAKTEAQKCAGCGKIISERFLLKAMDLFWHEDCLKCGCCDCRLGEVGSTLYTKANLILCKRDYLRLFGNTGCCAACTKVIPAFEMVMRAKHNVYHLECFACQQCSHRFCVGDRFYLCENKILCEYDFEERQVFAHMVYSPSTVAHLKRQTSHLPVSAQDAQPGGPGGTVTSPTTPALLNGSPPVNGSTRTPLAVTGGTGGTNGAGVQPSPGDPHRGDLNNNMGIVGSQSPLPFKNLPPLSMAGS
ncbi:LIM domain only protein 3-like isoform X1 [Thrips palmi]|uniref:LIM domain only protein 3-like isoform X1 n=1 Tax=Thrips palmi TaxID=161013 RepID=A0A6P8YD84_THRPL|nr:LIM domain only protein 3-like isoform X1 [Thrips palmi]XP_034234822.1 LIM domain only protein 3-like isoform X1 [Thrips palmi]XP_034234823.1 LIM domain only protein 3-like isoform X1 [Thrips palmi]XP_034234824.1 LIM domain only protein 3-like isoform X1 [Thrips palmi]XP_034234825.1 LIM domain only protein 3-like isoform X1 [Thrips palmi]